MIMFYNYEWVKINLFLYIVKPQNMKIFFIKKMPEKKCKANKTIFISYANTYKVDVLNSINPELQIKILNLQL